MRPTCMLALWCALGMALSACSGLDLLGLESGPSLDGPHRDKGKAPDSDPPNDELIIADDPVPIAGSFLICGHLEDADLYSAAVKDPKDNCGVAVGCGVFDRQSRGLLSVNHFDFEAIIRSGDVEESLDGRAAPPAASYRTIFDLEENDLPGGILFVRATHSSWSGQWIESEFDLPTLLPISEAVKIGSSLNDDDPIESWSDVRPSFIYYLAGNSPEPPPRKSPFANFGPPQASRKGGLFRLDQQQGFGGGIIDGIFDILVESTAVSGASRYGVDAKAFCEDAEDRTVTGRMQIANGAMSFIGGLLGRTPQDQAVRYDDFSADSLDKVLTPKSCFGDIYQSKDSDSKWADYFERNADGSNGCAVFLMDNVNLGGGNRDRVILVWDDINRDRYLELINLIEVQGDKCSDFVISRL